MVALAHLTGWLAVLALLASLGTSLAARAIREQRARLLVSRRLFGLAGAALALLHALVSLLALLVPPSLAEAVAMLSAVPYLRHGALAVVLLAPLALTSFPALNARLGLRTWDVLHRAVYVVIALVVLHVVAGPSADPRLALALAALAALLLFARIPRPRARAPRAPNDEPSDEPQARSESEADSVEG
jgi:sulfoxide reductase heme-binding subunit YedZ